MKLLLALLLGSGAVTASERFDPKSARLSRPGNGTVVASETPRVAFHYGLRPPLDELRAYDWVVLQPYAEVTLPRGTRFLAYVGLGEWQGEEDRLPAPCLLGRNPVWKSPIIDLRKRACRELLEARFLEPAWRLGFRGFFFDTLDSYRLVLPKAAWPTFEEALVTFLQRVRRRFPEAVVLINRGFELLDRLRGVVDGVVAESLYRGFDPVRGYFQVSEADRSWLLQQLAKARAEGVVPIAIDYLPVGKRRFRQEARRLARQILQHRIVPYIADGHLQRLGVGLVEVVPRKLLFIHDGDPERPNRTQLHRLLAIVANHLGYSVRPVPVGRLAQFPAFNGAYRGAVVWLEHDRPDTLNRLAGWLEEAREAGLPVLLLHASHRQLQTLAAVLDLQVGGWDDRLKAPLSVAFKAPAFGFEVEPLPDPEGFYPLSAREAEPWLVLKRGDREQLAAAKTPWGGYLIAPFGVASFDLTPQYGFDLTGVDLWEVDPFWLLEQALRLPKLPVADITTLTGRRALFIHVDGDSFLSRSTASGYRGRLAGEVCLREIFRRYPLPQSVSFIGAELEGKVPYVKGILGEARRIAREILRLPWIEPASHTYSHPFEWAELERHPERTGASRHAAYSLQVEGYDRFDPVKEIVHSVQIVDRFAPPVKKTRLLFWSGDADPGPETLELAYRNGLLNINGHPTTIRRRFPSLTLVEGHGVWKGGFFQVYPAFGNDNNFTAEWTHRYGFRSVISSFQLTERGGRRLKPLNIYYHFYSCELDAALKNLHEIYRAALSWNPHPIFTSTYIRMALAFERLVLARRLDGGFEITGYWPASTLRLPPELGYPDLERSQKVAGFRDTPFGRYLHLARGKRAVLFLTGSPPKRPYLVEANGQVVALGRDGIVLRSEAPRLEAGLHLPKGCSLEAFPPGRFRRRSGELLLRFPGAEGRLSWRCAAGEVLGRRSKPASGGYPG